MLKEGHKHLVGLDEAVLKNIEACKQLSNILKTSMGPNGAQAGTEIKANKPRASVLISRGRCAGMNKMVINHLERHFVTSDASTLMNELDVEHPAAKLVVLAARAQEQEIGDGTNFVRLVLFSAQNQAESWPSAALPAGGVLCRPAVGQCRGPALGRLAYFRGGCGLQPGRRQGQGTGHLLTLLAQRVSSCWHNAAHVMCAWCRPCRCSSPLCSLAPRSWICETLLRCAIH